MTDPKPLNWTPDPGIGYTVVRRPDGGGRAPMDGFTACRVNHVGPSKHSVTSSII